MEMLFEIKLENNFAESSVYTTKFEKWVRGNYRSFCEALFILSDINLKFMSRIIPITPKVRTGDIVAEF